MRLSGLLIAFDPFSSAAPVQTLTRTTWSLKCKWKGRLRRLSHRGKSVPGTLSKAWKREEREISHYPRMVQLLAMGAGGHSPGPLLPPTPRRPCTERTEGEGLPGREATEMSKALVFLTPREIGTKGNLSTWLPNPTLEKQVALEYIVSNSLSASPALSSARCCASPPIKHLWKERGVYKAPLSLRRKVSALLGSSSKSNSLPCSPARSEHRMWVFTFSSTPWNWGGQSQLDFAVTLNIGPGQCFSGPDLGPERRQGRKTERADGEKLISKSGRTLGGSEVMAAGKRNWIQAPALQAGRTTGLEKDRDP